MACLHLVSCLLMLTVTVVAQSNSMGLMHSEASKSWAFVASCGAYDPAARVMVCSTTRSARLGIVWISTFLLPDPICARGHTHAITSSIFSPNGLLPVRMGTGSLHDSPVMKYTSEMSSYNTWSRSLNTCSCSSQMLTRY